MPRTEPSLKVVKKTDYTFIYRLLYVDEIATPTAYVIITIKYIDSNRVSKNKAYMKT